MTTTIRTLAALLLGAAAVSGLSACGTSPVTRARLERDLPKTFSNLYVQQARILGHRGITVASLHARAQCDKGGPKVPDRGPGSDWICMMAWKDPNVSADQLPGKFEMNVHSNACYTAGGPSKIIGLLTITDTHGNTVDNPVFEFDGCLDPHGDNHPTGVTVPTTSSSSTTTPPPPTPARLTSTGPPQIVHGRGIVVPVRCSGGTSGCAGTLTARRGRVTVGTATYAVAGGGRSTVAIPTRKGQSAAGVTVTGHAVIGSVAG